MSLSFCMPNGTTGSEGFLEFYFFPSEENQNLIKHQLHVPYSKTFFNKEKMELWHGLQTKTSSNDKSKRNTKIRNHVRQQEQTHEYQWNEQPISRIFRKQTLVPTERFPSSGFQEYIKIRHPYCNQILHQLNPKQQAIGKDSLKQKNMYIFKKVQSISGKHTERQYRVASFKQVYAKVFEAYTQHYGWSNNHHSQHHELHRKRNITSQLRMQRGCSHFLIASSSHTSTPTMTVALQ